MIKTDSLTTGLVFTWSEDLPIAEATLEKLLDEFNEKDMEVMHNPFIDLNTYTV